VKPHAFHPKAAEEYAEAAKYYTEIYPDLGRRFYDEMERLIRDIRREPKRFRRFDPPAQWHFFKCFSICSDLRRAARPHLDFGDDAPQPPSRLLEGPRLENTDAKRSRKNSNAI